MNEKILKKIFPKSGCLNIKNLKYDNEGLWSISYPDLADILSKHLKVFDSDDFKLSTIVDATAGLGGNLLSFSRYFEKIYGIEIDDTRFELLENNVKNYNQTNINCIKGNSIELLKSGDLIKFIENPDVIFFDPPWGGPNYKFEKDVELTLSDLTFDKIIELVYKLKKVKLVVLKFPFNYKFLELIKKCESFYNDFIIKKEKNVIFLFLKMNIEN